MAVRKRSVKKPTKKPVNNSRNGKLSAEQKLIEFITSRLVTAEEYFATELAKEYVEESKKSSDKKPIADQIVDLALNHYRLGISDQGDAFAVRRSGPLVAAMFKGGVSSLRMQLSSLFHRMTDKVPNASALGDALTTLEGKAIECEPEPVALRVSEYQGGIVLDLADQHGQVVVVMVGSSRMNHLYCFAGQS